MKLPIAVICGSRFILNTGPFDSFWAANRGLNSSVEDHGTELEHREDTPLMADPSLGEEDGSGAGQLDQCPEDYEQRKEPEQGRRRQTRSRARFTAIRSAVPITAVRNSPATLESAGAQAGKVCNSRTLVVYKEYLSGG